MLFLHQALRAGLALTALAALTACSSNEAHDHDHDHGGEHSGGHAHGAPHDGELAELGDHFAHLEAVHDPEAGSLMIYAIDFHSSVWPKSPTEALEVTIDTHEGEPMVLTLAADESELRGNKKGGTSQFNVTDEQLVGLDHFHCTVAKISVKGEVFEDIQFDFGDDDDHDGDDHEGHDHDGDDHEHDKKG